MTMHTNDSGCPICGSKKVIFAFQGKDRLHHIEGTFNVKKCEDCACFFRLPRLGFTDLKKYYPQGKYEAYVLDKSFILKIISGFALKAKSRYITRLLGKGSLLDVGCARGKFLQEMRRRGWDVQGIEPDRNSVEAAQKSGLQVKEGIFEGAQYPPEVFDVITMWHVLEHMQDPSKDLEQASRALKKGGFLVFSVPNIDSLEAKAFRHLWSGFDVPRHSFVYSKKGLKIIFSRIGLVEKEVRTRFGGFDSFNHSLGFFLDEKCGNPGLRDFIKRTARSLFLRFPFTPFLYLVERLGKGPVIIYTLSKEDKSR